MAEESTGTVTKGFVVVAALSVALAFWGLLFALVYPDIAVFTPLARLVYSLGVFGTSPLLLWYRYRNSESRKRAKIRREASTAEDDDPHSREPPSETAEVTALAKGGLPAGYLSTVKLLAGVAGMTSTATLIGVSVPFSLPVVGSVSLVWYLYPLLGLAGYFFYIWFFDAVGDLLYRVVS
ncbi:hypothetical protein [Haloarcula rara]|uniref:hypothetical protein n=1 Tax=Haloarcula rara TaxID=3033387 RepID=UPI0023E8B006|nr:hypothetical protein [Halomicroarcula sp. SHR3]